MSIIQPNILGAAVREVLDDFDLWFFGLEMIRQVLMRSPFGLAFGFFYLVSAGFLDHHASHTTSYQLNSYLFLWMTC